MRNGSKMCSNVVTMDGVKLPKFVLDVPPLWPKHPVRDKINEVHFLADIDKPVRGLRGNKTEIEKLCKIEACVKLFARNVREIPMDKEVKSALLPSNQGLAGGPV